jgi:hypothetical protein
MKVVPTTFALAVLAAWGCASAKSQGAVILDTKLPVTFGQVSNVIELGDGRVAFVDMKSKIFVTADFTSGRIDTLGSRVDSLPAGAPAAQYKFPGWVAHLSGDTIALVDFAGQRTTLWSEGGQAMAVLPIPPFAGPTPVMVYDTVGHGYKIDYQEILGGGEPGKAARPDSIPVLRITFKSYKADTIVKLRAPEFGSARFGEQVQETVKVFAPNDFFGVLSDGTAWVARGHENRVDWRAPDGTWIPGTSRDYERIPVTQADRDRVLTQVREQGKQYGMPQELKIEYPFADTKPPFDFALARPNGEVWLQRSRAQENAAIVYDVFDRKGTWRRDVEFPAGAALAGFGKGAAVYGTVKEANGLRTVARFKVN